MCTLATSSIMQAMAGGSLSSTMPMSETMSTKSSRIMAGALTSMVFRRTRVLRTIAHRRRPLGPGIGSLGIAASGARAATRLSIIARIPASFASGVWGRRANSRSKFIVPHNTVCSRRQGPSGPRASRARLIQGVMQLRDKGILRAAEGTRTHSRTRDSRLLLIEAAKVAKGTLFTRKWQDP